MGVREGDDGKLPRKFRKIEASCLVRFPRFSADKFSLSSGLE